MGFLIGGPDTTIFGGLSTWGKLRTAVGQSTPSFNYSQPTVKEDFNRGWDPAVYFMSASTDSFVKLGYSLGPNDEPTTANMLFPFIFITAAVLPLDVIASLNNSFEDDPLLSQLVGELVTGYGGTFAITAGMNINPSVNVTGGGPLTSTLITSVGKLTPIT
jgi:hypothetical protein